MKLKHLHILSLLLTFCIALNGQVPDTTRNSSSDSVQIVQFDKISNDIILVEIVEIQGQIINNLNYMMDYLFENQKRMEIKLDSVLNVLQKENIDSLKIRKKKRRRKTQL